MNGMMDGKSARAVIAVALVIAAVAAAAWMWPRTDALSAALQPLIEQQQDAVLSRVAGTLLDNYVETRQAATMWSSVYWGFTFGAALFSALAGLILKFEWAVKEEKMKKDAAAVLSVAAALLVTITTSGDFQRKWQANRVAAAELERAGYLLLQNGAGASGGSYATIGDILHKRNLAIVGTLDEKNRPPKPGETQPSGE